MTGPFEVSGDAGTAGSVLESLRTGRALFALVISYTATCEIPGITAAGASRELLRSTPPADAEYIHYGYCRSIDGVPATPDGKPTPALLTKAALEHASIPHVTVSAGSAAPPMLPYIESGLRPGGNIAEGPAMTDSDVSRAVDYGRIVGRTLASLADCLVIGESVPGGTTTALAVLRGLGHDAQTSSSMPENPSALKDGVASAAVGRIGSEHPYSIVAEVGDPMIAFVAGMLSSASASSRVLLAGGTQMAAVLAFAGRIGFAADGTAVGTTSYVAGDPSADLAAAASEISGTPVISVDPGLAASRTPGLRAFSEGFAKEGAGAGGCIISCMARSGIGREGYLALAEAEHARLTRR